MDEQERLSTKSGGRARTREVISDKNVWRQVRRTALGSNALWVFVNPTRESHDFGANAFRHGIHTCFTLIPSVAAESVAAESVAAESVPAIFDTLVRSCIRFATVQSRSRVCDQESVPEDAVAMSDSHPKMRQ